MAHARNVFNKTENKNKRIKLRSLMSTMVSDQLEYRRRREANKRRQFRIRIRYTENATEKQRLIKLYNKKVHEQIGKQVLRTNVPPSVHKHQENIKRQEKLKKLGEKKIQQSPTLYNKNMAAKKIQQAFRKSRLTNEGFRKLWNKSRSTLHNNNASALTSVTKQQWRKMNSYAKKLTGASGSSAHVNALHTMQAKRNTNATPAVTTIQRIFRGYKSRDIDPQIQFLISLGKDERFDYYQSVLANLYMSINGVLRNIAWHKNNPHKAIHNTIGVCHYKAKPYKIVQKVTNVRKNLPLLKKKTPREYLKRLRSQFIYVAKEYAKMSSDNKKAYRDRLHSELSGRPCLENMMDSLVKALVKPEFVWLGKAKNFQNDPMMPNNVRYVGFGPNLGGQRGLINTAVTTWAQSKNRPANWNSKNVNTRKQVFWNMIKNLPLSMVHNGNIVNGRPRLYNANGTKFKKSQLANTLEYV